MKMKHWSDYQDFTARHSDKIGTYRGFTGWVVDGHGTGAEMLVLLQNADGENVEALAADVEWVA